MRSPQRVNLSRAFDFALWMQSQPTVPTPSEVSHYLQTSLEAARRWRNAWLSRKRA